MDEQPHGQTSAARPTIGTEVTNDPAPIIAGTSTPELGKTVVTGTQEAHDEEKLPPASGQPGEPGNRAPEEAWRAAVESLARKLAEIEGRCESLETASQGLERAGQRMEHRASRLAGTEKKTEPGAVIGPQTSAGGNAEAIGSGPGHSLRGTGTPNGTGLKIQSDVHAEKFEATGGGTSNKSDPLPTLTDGQPSVRLWKSAEATPPGDKVAALSDPDEPRGRAVAGEQSARLGLSEINATILREQERLLELAALVGTREAAWQQAIAGLQQRLTSLEMRQENLRNIQGGQG